jgi:hypothetical protein
MNNNTTTTEQAPVTLGDSIKFDNLVEEFLFDSLLIGELCRKGKQVFYALLDGVYYEAPTKLLVAQKLASKSINR